jgi:acetyl-CoA C-acetyltransferase
MTSPAYILGAARTPIGKFLGGLADVAPPGLAAVAMQEALARARLSAAQVDEVILGLVLSAGVGQAPARQAALAAGLPDSVAAVTINKVCGSGLKAVMLADQAIRAGDARCVVAGGMENMSQAPFFLRGGRQGWKAGDQSLVDSMLYDGLRCASRDQLMGASAEYTARKFNISRRRQDEFSLESHRRAIAARSATRAEIVPVPLRGAADSLDRDECPRDDASLERMAQLRSAFETEGTVTAGNASQLADGAAAVVVVDEATARAADVPLKARIVATATSGVAPKDLFVAPVLAIRLVLEKAGLTPADLDLIELNEAFAAQCLACIDELDLPHEKLNVRGGAIAMGHPIGASGARVLVTLLYALAERNARLGLASLCLGGGNAVAMVVERM